MDQDVLKEYLAKEEVASIMFGGFDKEKQLEYLMSEERAEGVFDTLKKMVQLGKLTLAEAANEANMTPEDFAKKAGLKMA